MTTLMGGFRLEAALVFTDQPLLVITDVLVVNPAGLHRRAAVVQQTELRLFYAFLAPLALYLLNVWDCNCK